MSPTIDSLLEDAVSSHRFLGLSFIAVNSASNMIYSAAHGYRTFSCDEAMTIQTGGWMASMSKVMTSVAAMIAVEKGLVGLDDDVAKILPELHEKRILLAFDNNTNTGQFEPVREVITLRRLMTHSAGFAYSPLHPALNQWAVANNKTMERFFGDFKKDWDQSLVFQPGPNWCYSTGLDWAGKIVEKVSKKTLEEFMQANIWTPLSMKNTTFHPERREAFPMLAMGTRSTRNSPLVPAKLIYPIPAQNEAGGAGLFSNCEDYAKLLGALLCDDSPILNKESIEKFVEPQLSQASRRGLDEKRGMGLVLSEIPNEIPTNHALGGLYLEAAVPGGRSKGSITWDGMSSSNWLLDRSAGVALVLFVQVMVVDWDTKRLWMELEQEVYKLISHT